MEVASYDICFKANEHTAIADIFDRSTAYVWIEDWDVDIYDERDVFVDFCGEELKDKHYYVPFDVAKANNPPCHELIPAPSMDEILEAFKSLRVFGVKGEVIFKMDTGGYAAKATFFRFLPSTDKAMKKHVSITFEADDSIKPVETLAAIPAEHLDNELLGKSLEKVCKTLDCVSYAYESLREDDSRVLRALRNAVLFIVQCAITSVLTLLFERIFFGRCEPWTAALSVPWTAVLWLLSGVSKNNDGKKENER